MAVFAVIVSAILFHVAVSFLMSTKTKEIEESWKKENRELVSCLENLLKSRLV